MKIEIVLKEDNIYVRKKKFFGLYVVYLDCFKNYLNQYKYHYWWYSIESATSFPSVEEAKLAITHYETELRHTKEYRKEQRRKRKSPITVIERIR